ncbi:MAG: hypothetical protein QG635_491 [Bacteroidota bacterium]|nr:hypothetical protein [Bacteroidota bacterium]
MKNNFFKMINISKRIVTKPSFIVINTLFICSLIIIFLIGQFSVIAQVSLPNEIKAYKTNEVIKLDGRLDEQCWGSAVRITNFTQREQDEGAKPTERTEVAAVYTRDALYFGIWCFDSQPDELSAKNMKRDFIYWEEDNFEILLDTFWDKRNGYVFVINPNGARSDVQITDEGKGFCMDWNGVWDAAVENNEQGWFAEIKIPFSSLKYIDNDTQTWGINFERNIRRKKECLFWQGWSRNYEFEYVSNAGKLTGLLGIEHSETVEIKPFLMGGIETSPVQHPENITKIGGDINYAVSPTLKLNLTANTDFAQVESDKAIINLSRFSQYYPEKRDFFLEGMDVFSFGLGSDAQFFYSRRIGLDDGVEIPIIGGARLIGKAGSTNIGLLSIQTSEKNSVKSANYSVIRLKQDVFRQSYIGMLITAKNQPDDYNYVYGIDGSYSTTQLFGNNNLTISGNLTQSSNNDSAGGNNLAYKLLLSYPNDFIRFYAGIDGVQKNFNPEVGFMRRSNYKQLYSELIIRPRPEFLSWIHVLSFKPYRINLYFTDATNELESYHFQIIPFGFDSKSGESLYLYINHDYDRLDEDFNIYENIILERGKYDFTKYGAEFSSFAGRALSVYTNISVGEYYSGRGFSFYGEMKWNINRNINISGDYEHIDLKFDEGILATTNIGGRVEYAFTTKLYSSLFGQWNNESKQVILNIRINWIPVIGSDFYMALNQILNSDSSVQMGTTTIIAKFVWRFSI